MVCWSCPPIFVEVTSSTDSVCGVELTDYFVCSVFIQYYVINPCIVVLFYFIAIECLIKITFPFQTICIITFLFCFRTIQQHTYYSVQDYKYGSRKRFSFHFMVANILPAAVSSPTFRHSKCFCCIFLTLNFLLDSSGHDLPPHVVTKLIWLFLMW